MDIRKQFGTDSKKEIEGVWQDFGEGCKVLIARIGNPEYQKVFRRISKPYKKAIRRETLGEEKSEELLCRSLADAIVLDWKGLKEDGKDLKYSADTAFRILKEYKDFRDQVMEIANEMETFKAEDDEEAEKNLPKS